MPSRASFGGLMPQGRIGGGPQTSRGNVTVEVPVYDAQGGGQAVARLIYFELARPYDGTTI